MRQCKACCIATSAKQREGESRQHYLQYQIEYKKTKRPEKHKERIAWLDAQKAKPCEDCRNTFPPECMDFDHIDPSTKLFNVSQAVVSGNNLDSITAEIAKCRLICANCHRIRTARQQRRSGIAERECV